jgi:hypothetical protein
MIKTGFKMKIYLGGANDPPHDTQVAKMTGRRLISFWTYFPASGCFYKLTDRIHLVTTGKKEETSLH